MAYIGVQPTSVPLTSSDITDGIITTAKIADDAVGNTKLNLASDYAFTGTVSGAGDPSKFVKIHEEIVSSSVTHLAFTSTYITDTYHTYIVYIDGVLNASDNAGFRTLVSIDNGSNFVTCRGSADHLLLGGGNSDGASGAMAYHQISASAENSATGDLNGSCTFYNLRSNTHHKSSHSEVGVRHSDGQYSMKYDGIGVHETDSKVNYIKFFGTSNLTSGRFKLYGIKD